MDEAAATGGEPAAEPGTRRPFVAPAHEVEDGVPMGDALRAAVRRAPVVVVECAFSEETTFEAHPLRARHVDGVERIAAALNAVDPVVWEGSRAWLSCAAAPPEQQVTLAWRMAVELWQRGLIDLDLPVRIAVTFCAVGPGGAPVTGGDSADETTGLLARTPERAIVVSEDVALCLRVEHRSELRPGGVLDDGRNLYVFAADASKKGPRQDTEDLPLWTEFEAYALSPAIREIHYVGFRLPRRAPPVLDLADVFVQPGAVAWRQRTGQGFPSGEEGADGAEAMASLLGLTIQRALVRHHHLVVLGEPGAGKTTLLKWLAIVAAEGHWPALTREAGARLPLLISVGRLAEVLAPGDAPSSTVLARYFGVRDGALADAVASFLHRQLEAGRCLVLLDGLDEVRAEDRELTEAWLRDFAARYPQNRFVATSRFVGYSGLRLPEDAAVVRLTALDASARRRFVRAFCNAYLKWETGEERAAEAEAQATALLQAIEASDRLSALARNPFMLSALALIHRAEGRLPRHRVQAYQMFLRALCETWSEARKLVSGGAPIGDAAAGVAYEEEAIPVLGELALAMHERFPRGIAPVEIVRQVIASALKAREELDDATALAAADVFLKRAGEEVQILLERGAGQWGFLHLTFQELFVAAGLHAGERFDDVAMEHLLEPRWEEVIRLGVGYLALVQARPVAAQRFLEKVLAYEAPAPWRRAAKILGKHIGLAAMLAVEAGDALPPRTQRRIAEAFAGWLCDGPPREVADSGAPEDLGEKVSQWLRQIALSEVANPFIDALIRRASAGDVRGRRHAVNALERMDARVPPAVLVNLLVVDSLAHPSWFGTLLAHSASSDELCELAHHGNERVRAALAQAAELRPAAERASILEALVGDPSPNVREVAAQLPLLGARQHGGFYAPETMTPEEEARLLPFLEDPSEPVRRRALVRLRQSTNGAVQTAVEELLRYDPSPEVRRQAAMNLAATGQLTGFETAVLTFAEHMGESEWDVARVFLLGWKDVEERIDWLLRLLEAPQTSLRATAAFLLGGAAMNRQVEEIHRFGEMDAALAACVADPDPLVRRETLRSLDVRGERSFAAAVAATDDPDPDVREAAFVAVSRRGLFVDVFTKGLNDTNPAVRALCLNVLPALSPEARERRFEIAAADPDPKVRSALVQWLGLAGDAKEALLKRLLTDPTPDVRSTAVWALVNQQLQVSADAVAPLLRDTNIGVVAGAARVLAQAGDDGMRILVEHADVPAARAALWQWAEARQWAFPPS